MHYGSSQRISICIKSLNPSLRRTVGRGPGDTCTRSGLHYKRGIPSLGKLTSFIMGNKYAICCGRDILSFRTVHYINIVGKHLNKGIQCHCSQDVQKIEENHGELSLKTAKWIFSISLMLFAS